MTVKLSKIFIPLPDKVTYSTEELSALNLQLDFIKKTAARFDLSFEEQATLEGNVCFAENMEVQPEYRNTFSKADIMEIILPQLVHSMINLEQDEVVFPEDIHSFFQHPLQKKV